jgi:hypothetical protein
MLLGSQGGGVVRTRVNTTGVSLIYDLFMIYYLFIYVIYTFLYLIIIIYS